MSLSCAPAEVDLIQHFNTARGAVASAQRRLFSSIAECDRREVWRKDGCRDMGQWVSGRVGISNWAAARWVHAAHALECLPGIAAAFERGTLSLDKVVELARFATAETEDDLMRWARRVSVACIRRKADLANRPSVEDVTETDRSRYLRHWWFDDGKRLGLEGSWPADQGAVIQKALDRLAERVPSMPQEPGREPDPFDDGVDTRRADALLLLASGTIAKDPDPDRATVVVHADIGTLNRDEGGCYIEDGPVVHPEVARRLACDARLEVVLHDNDGHAVGIGRASRTPPRWLVRQLKHRDGRCTFPGCDFKRFLHPHHIKYWIPDGETNLDNLILVCTFHHKLVHEYRWRVELGDIPGTARWFRPDGTPYDPARASPHSAAA
jgi:Domain of unknown function (DUF222)